MKICIKANAFLFIIFFIFKRKMKSLKYLYAHNVKEVFKYIKKRLDEGLPVVPISMNISRLHLLDDALIDYIRILLDEYKIPTEYIEFELTESIYMDNMEQVLELMKNLSALGIQVSMDDFGSGYSSLNVLNNIPIDTLKLDRVFLSDATLNDKQLIILASVIVFTFF